MRKNKKQYKSYRDIAKDMGVSEWTIWKLMDKIRLRFERNKNFMYYFSKGMDVEDIIFKLEEH